MDIYCTKCFKPLKRVLSHIKFRHGFGWRRIFSFF